MWYVVSATLRARQRLCLHGPAGSYCQVRAAPWLPGQEVEDSRCLVRKMSAMSIPFTTDRERDGLQRALAEANGFRLDALASNRAGRLTPEQTHDLRTEQGTDRWIFILLGIPTTLMSGVWLGNRALHAGLSGLLHERIAFAVFAAGLILVWAGARWKEYRREFTDAAVEAVDGRGRKLVRSLSAGSGGSAHYTLVVGDLDFEVSARGYGSFIEGVHYRAYYVSQRHARTLVNVEVLAPFTAV